MTPKALSIKGKTNTMKYHYAYTTIMTIIKITDHIQRRREYEKTGTLIHCWWECKLLHLLWKKVWQCLRVQLIIQASGSTPCNLPKTNKSIYAPTDLPASVHSIVFRNSQKNGNNLNAHKEVTSIPYNYHTFVFSELGKHS